MSAEPVRYEDADGSIFAAEIVPPDAAREPYHVDLLRASVDDYGLAREQRLTVGEYSSWGEAEEHLYEIEDGLAEDGLAALGDDAQRLREQPYEDDIFYMAATYPPDAPVGEGNAAAHLLAVGQNGIDSAALAVGERETVEWVVDRMDRILRYRWRAMTALAATTPRFDSDDAAVRHVDSGGTAHWFQIVERDEPQDSPYELRYFRALDYKAMTQRADSILSCRCWTMMRHPPGRCPDWKCICRKAMSTWPSSSPMMWPRSTVRISPIPSLCPPSTRRRNTISVLAWGRTTSRLWKR